MILLPGDQLEFSEGGLEKLGSEVSDLLNDMERDHAPMFNDYAVRWDWYEATPVSKRKTFPFRNAANMVVPIIQAHADAIVSRLWGAVHRFNKLFAIQTENEEFANNGRPEIETFMNLAARREFDAFFSTLDWITEFAVQGESVLALNWGAQQEFMLTPSLARDVRNARRAGKRPDLRFVTKRRGPIWEYVPRTQMMWMPWGCHVADAEAISRQFFLTPTEVRFQAQTGKWIRESVEAIDGQTGGEGAGFETRKRQRERSGLAGEESHQPHDVREVSVSWPLLDSMKVGRGDFDVFENRTRAGNTKRERVNPFESELDVPSVPLVVTLHRKTKQVLSVRPKPYMIEGWPFVDLYFRRRPGASSAGIAKKLEPIQRAISVAVNQSFDAVTRANAIWAKTTDVRLQSWQFSPSEPVKVTNMEDFELLAAPKSVLPEIQIINLINAFGERLSGVSDPLMGRESRSGGHPSPATNFLGMLEEAGKLMFPAAAAINRQLGRAGSITASLYQQFDTDEEGRLERTMGVGDAAKVKQWMFPQEGIGAISEFEVASLSGIINPDVEMRRATLISQVTRNYFAAILQVVPTLSNPQIDPLTKDVVKDAIGAFTSAHRRFLEAGEVDDLERYIHEFDAQRADAVERIGRIEALARQGGGAAPGNGAPGNGGGAGGPGGAFPFPQGQAGSA